MPPSTPSTPAAPSATSPLDDLDEVRPWARQPYDTDGGYHAFTTYYLSQDPPRSVLRAYRAYRAVLAAQRGEEPTEVSCVPGYFNNWQGGADGHGERIPGALTWTQRAQAYDDYLAEQDRLAWEKRRREIREEEYKAARALFQRGADMLKFPLQRVVLDGETGATIIEPVGWKLGDIPRVMHAASQLGRLSAGMDTDQIGVRAAGQVTSDEMAAARDLAVQYRAEQEARTAPARLPPPPPTAELLDDLLPAHFER